MNFLFQNFQSDWKGKYTIELTLFVHRTCTENWDFQVLQEVIYQTLCLY